MCGKVLGGENVPIGKGWVMEENGMAELIGIVWNIG
jgi:hypothetical protein